LIKVAAIVFLAYLGMFAWVDDRPQSPMAEYLDWLLYLAAGLAGLAVLNMLYQFLIGIGSKVKRSRCIRCGAKTEPGLLYCKRHLREARRELMERQARR